MLETVSGSNPVSAFLGMFQDPTNRWFALYLALSVVIGSGAYLFEAHRDPELKAAGLARFLLPPHIYTHRSAIADYWFYVINKFLFALAFAFLIGVSSSAANIAGAFFHAIGNSPRLEMPNWAAILITTVISALAMDFGLWLGHYFLHKVPVLWEFHKVHHSAEVLTPVTAGRVHPLEDAMNILFSGIFGGVSLALCRFLLGPDTAMFGIFQLNALVFTFYVFGFHLRHSHIWVPYKGIWGKLFVSPAHHQLHHSVERRHWDKNFGFVFAIWDWMFGTLYSVDKRETFAIGMNGHEEAEYHSVRALYFLPFVKVWRRLRQRKVDNQAGATSAPLADGRGELPVEPGASAIQSG